MEEVREGEGKTNQQLSLPRIWNRGCVTN